MILSKPDVYQSYVNNFGLKIHITPDGDAELKTGVSFNDQCFQRNGTFEVPVGETVRL